MLETLKGEMMSQSHNVDDLLPVGSVGKGSTHTESKVILSPDFARDFLKLSEFVAERNQDAGWSSHLADEMSRNMFRYEHVHLAQARLKGQVFRVNGQHCCFARLELEDEEQHSQEVTLLDYTVKTYEDLRLLYIAFDNHRPRTRAQRLAAALKGFEKWEEVSDKMMRHVTSGFGVWQAETRGDQIKDPANVGFLLQTQYQSLGVAVGEFLGEHASGRASKHVLKAGVIGGILATFDKNRRDAAEFWKVIASGIGIEAAEDPRRLLRDSLMTVNGKAPGKRNLTLNEYLFRMSILAWNAHRAGETRKNLVVREGDRPKVK